MNSLTTSPWGFSSVASSLDRFEALPISTSTPSFSGISYGNAFLIHSHSYGDERGLDGALILTELEKSGVSMVDKNEVLVFLIQNQFPLETIKEGFEAIRREFPTESLQLGVFIDAETLKETLFFSVNVSDVEKDINESVGKITRATRKWMDDKPSRYSDLLSIDLRAV